MNRFEEYFSNLDKKNLIMLYLSLIIAAGVIYYNFNYSVLQNRIEENYVEINKLKSKKPQNLNTKLVTLKKKYKLLKKTQETLSEDLKYLNLLLKTSSILKMSDKKMLNILRDILQYAIDNNIVASYDMRFVSDKYNNYIINVKGSFDAKRFNDFYGFVKSIENMKSIKEIKILKFSNKENIEFNMQIYFWGLK